jgi:hypothetical protein
MRRAAPAFLFALPAAALRSDDGYRTGPEPSPKRGTPNSVQGSVRVTTESGPSARTVNGADIQRSPFLTQAV